MKYSKEDALKEIKRRARVIRQKHDKRMLNALSAAAGFTLIALFAVIGSISESEVSKSQTDYGAFILSTETGGYVLTAVLGFVLGVCVTLLIRQLKKKNRQ